MKIILTNPTGKGIRSDSAGDGVYGASRGSRMHEGTDYLCDPGQEVVSPINGVVKREARPYASGPYSGVLIKGSNLAIKMFYFELDKSLIGKFVHAGDVIGKAQDISEKHKGGMQPHVHLQIEHINPDLFVVHNQEV